MRPCSTSSRLGSIPPIKAYALRWREVRCHLCNNRTIAIAIGGDIRLTDMHPLLPEDQGSQDTVWVAPGEVLRIEALFDKPGEYVWHCHILSHEDHEMMRPFEVIGTDRTMLAELPPLDAGQPLVEREADMSCQGRMRWRTGRVLTVADRIAHGGGGPTHIHGVS